MEIAVFDLSRTARPYDDRLNPVFRDSTVTQIDKAAWKKLGARQLFLAARALRVDLFLICVDDFSSIQDGVLLKGLGVVSAAKRFALLETTTGRIQYVSLPRFLLVDVPLAAAEFLLTAIFGAAFFLLVVALLGLCWLRRGDIRAGYGATKPIRKVGYLKCDLSLNISAGGSISHTQGVIGGFLSNGVAVRIVSNEDVPWLKIPNAEVHVVGRTKAFSVIRETERMANGLFLAARALRVLREFSPDAIYQRKCSLDLSGVVLSLWGRVPLIIEGNDSVTHTLYWERPRLRWLAALVERLQFAASTRAVSISQVVLDQFRQQGYDACRIKVILNGVDVGLFNNEAALSQVADIRQSYGATPEDIVIGFVGTFGQWHGIGILTKAIIALVAERSNVLFLLVGDGELRVSCERELRDGGAIDRVRFTGLVTANRVPGLLAACDVLVSPHSRSPDGSRFIGSPTKLFEYMAAAKAIVASDLDQIGEVLEHDVSALLFEPDSLPDFLSALHRVCSDDALRARLGAKARDVVSEKYTWHANVGHVIAFMPVAPAS